MSLWVQLTLKSTTDPDSEGRPGLVNLERALWMEACEDGTAGSVIRFGSDESLTVGESLEEIAELLDAAEDLEGDLETDEEME